jgi:hypothetical protein
MQSMQLAYEVRQDRFVQFSPDDQKLVRRIHRIMLVGYSSVALMLTTVVVGHLL